MVCFADWYNSFTPDTRCVVFGMQTRAVQGMLDFDFMCHRKKPSVAAMIFPFSGNHFQKFYWGDTEIMLPVLSSTKEALLTNPDVEVFVNFASFRSVFETTQEALSYPQIRTVCPVLNLRARSCPHS
jgi:ATP citrate (pro-S)-lyase